MKYQSVREWRDLEDGHLYHAGEPFPHDGRELPAERYAELSGGQNKAGFAVIEPCPVPNKENPKQDEGTPKKAAKSRKKGE